MVTPPGLARVRLPFLLRCQGIGPCSAGSTKKNLPQRRQDAKADPQRRQESKKNSGLGLLSSCSSSCLLCVLASLREVLLPRSRSGRGAKGHQRALDRLAGHLPPLPLLFLGQHLEDALAGRPVPGRNGRAAPGRPHPPEEGLV